MNSLFHTTTVLEQDFSGLYIRGNPSICCFRANKLKYCDVLSILAALKTHYRDTFPSIALKMLIFTDSNEASSTVSAKSTMSTHERYRLNEGALRRIIYLEVLNHAAMRGRSNYRQSNPQT